jgi:SAM-dependent methyltransferase
VRREMRKRERFLSEVLRDIRLPYEVESKGHAEFENETEEEYFQYTVDEAEPRAVILDLACGDGRHTLRFADSVESVVGLDFSHNGLVKAKKRCLAKDNVTLIEGSMFKLPFSPNRFDGIWFSQAFEYVAPDKRRTLLSSLNDMLKSSGILYMSVETSESPSIVVSLKQFWRDFRLFCYWKFIKRKPLLWGEYFWYLSPETVGFDYAGWHYHVHTNKGTLCELLDVCGFTIEKMNLSDEYIYVWCRKTSG